MDPLYIVAIFFSAGLLLPQAGLQQPPDNALSPSRLIDPVPRPGGPRLSPFDQREVNWNGAFLQSGLFLMLQNGFRLATEPGTRQELKGPYIRDYFRSVGGLHGWADGDEFYVNYVGHPIQGAAAGFIFTRNDIPRYRFVEFGRNRDYWMSRLRATAFSWAYSEQFEIGPFSEASIGNIQRTFPQQGLVDHVITPVVGLGWMIAEDSLDKYVIRRFESRITNPYARMIVRSVVNPTRSFANMVAFQVPWHRDSRPGLFSYDPAGQRAARFLAARATERSLGGTGPSAEESQAVVAPFEFEMNYSPSRYLGAGGTACLGGGAVAALRLAPRVQALLEIGGCKLRGLDREWSGDSLHYVAGVRWIPWSARRLRSQVQFLAGGEKITHEQMFPDKKAQLMAAWKAQGSNPDKMPRFEDYAKFSETNGFSLQGGLGFDYRLNSALQWRLASLDYRHTWYPPLDGRDYGSSVNFTTGLVLRLGTW